MVRVEFTGRVKLSVTLLFSESFTVTLKTIDVAACGVPNRIPAGERVKPLGSPVADHW